MPMPMPMPVSVSVSVSVTVSLCLSCTFDYARVCAALQAVICYVSTYFRYILTTLVLIRNIFRFTTLKINAYLFFRRGYGKLIV